ncbi:MAG: TrkH family potassium uptake protein, partial [Candidatus Riflebacteria bacterium]|nr:TrkH family potassium uptake protein [Candidatus Riflebacteria bacterium]
MTQPLVGLREIEYLKQRYAAILSFTGKILILSGIVMLSPLLIIMTHPSESVHAMSFIFPALLQFLLGFALQIKFPHRQGITLSTQEGGIIVFISWLVVIAFSAW